MSDLNAKNTDRGINMHVVTEVQHIVIMAEHKLLDYKDVEKRFAQIKPLRYPRWLLVFMVGLSCACFCKLNNGGWDGALVTFCASTVAMYIRRYSPIVQCIRKSTFASPPLSQRLSPG